MKLKKKIHQLIKYPITVLIKKKYQHIISNFITHLQRDTVAKDMSLISYYLVLRDLSTGFINMSNLLLYQKIELNYVTAKSTTAKSIKYLKILNSIGEIIDSLKTDLLLLEKTIPIDCSKITLRELFLLTTSLRYKRRILHTRLLVKEKNLTESDKLRLLNGYADLFNDCGIVILLPTCLNQWEHYQTMLTEKLILIDSVDFDYSDNPFYFEQLLKEIYTNSSGANATIDTCITALKDISCKFRVLLLSEKERTNIYCALKEFHKLSMNPDNVLQLICSKNMEEFEYLRQLVLSSNNLYHLKLRTNNYNHNLLTRLDSLKKLLHEKNIPIQDVCISGSGGLEIIGLKQAHDIDFIVCNTHRPRFGNKTTLWNADLEYIRKNGVRTDIDIAFSDDKLISDNDLHYLFYGFKFINLNIIIAKKKYYHRQKDIADILLYETFMQNRVADGFIQDQ